MPREHRTERAAERYARDWLCEHTEQRLAELPTAAAGRRRPENRRCAASRPRWLALNEKNPKLSPATRKQHKGARRVHVLAYPEVADVPIVDLGPAVLRAWVRKVRDHGKTRPTWETVDGRKEVRKLV